MGVRVIRYANTASRLQDPIYVDSTQEQREATVDGYTFHWGPNEVRNFLDEGVGRAYAAFAPGTSVVLDIIPFGTATS